MNTRLAALIILFLAAGMPAAASRADLPQDAIGWQPDSEARLRILDPSLVRLVWLGLEQSVILRSLVADIESGDVMVYVGRDINMPGRLAGRLTFLGHGGRFRYVRISINSAQSENALLAALAHELQHVREIMAHPEVQDTASLANLYRQIGRDWQVAGMLAFETEAAQKVAQDVRREIVGAKSERAARRSAELRHHLEVGEDGSRR